MPRPSVWNRTDVRAVAATQLHLITAAQLTTLGVPRSAVSRSDELGGMFTWVLPGIHRVDGRGPLTPDQRDLAALLYGGSESGLTGAGVLRRRGVRAAAHPAFGPSDHAHLLVPHHCKRASRVFAQVERTVWVPEYRHDGLLRLAPTARATLDAVRRCTDEEAVKALMFEVVQKRLTSPESLSDERIRGQMRGSRYARLALEELAAGVRSVPEGVVRTLFLAAGIPRLLYNPTLFDAQGDFLACPDVYDPETGVCLEVESKEFHFSVADWQATMERHGRMTASGLAVIHVPPSRITRRGRDVVTEFERAIGVRRGWPTPPVRVA